MVRLRWSLIDGVYMATRRGYVVRVWRVGPILPSQESTAAYSVKTPDRTVHTRSAKSIDSAKRRARNLLVKLTPAVEKKEQLMFSGGTTVNT